MKISGLLGPDKNRMGAVDYLDIYHKCLNFQAHQTQDKWILFGISHHR